MDEINMMSAYSAVSHGHCHPRPVAALAEQARTLTGIEIDTARVSERALWERLLRNSMFSKDTHDTVIRLAPPLVITQEEIDEALAAIRATLADFDGAKPA